MERRRAPLLRQFFFAILRRRLYLRDCDISFITSWAIPRIRNIASPRGGKETISSLHHKSGHNRRQRPNERSPNASLFSGIWKEVLSSSSLTAVIGKVTLHRRKCSGMHNAEVKGGSEYIRHARGITRGSIPFPFCLERRISFLRGERISRVLMRSINLFLAHLPRCIMPPSSAPLEMKSSMEE